MLTIHKSRGFKTTTLSELENVPVTPRGERSDRWQGVQHAELVRSIGDGFENIGMKPKDVQLTVQKSGHGLVGAFIFDTPEQNRIPGAPDMDLACGFIHSNDSRRALHGAVGNQVSICGNGMCSGEFTWSRKHTNRLTIEEWVQMGIEQYAGSIERNQERVSVLVDTPMNVRSADRALVEMGQRKILSWKRIGQVDQLWRNPAHEEFREPTAFNFYQAFNEVVKETPMQSQFHTLRRGFNSITAISRQYASMN